MSRTEPCVCGGTITAPDLASSAPAVLRHSRTKQHEAWRRSFLVKQCPGYESPCAVTIPAHQDLCRFCTRTRDLFVRSAVA